MIKRFKNRKGAVAAMAVIITVVLLGFTALGVDIGMVVTSRNQLQNTADSAAMAAASRLYFMNYTEIVNTAKEYAGRNMVLNEPVVLQDSDIEIFGNSDVLQRRVRVTARRISARGNPINLMFGRAIGYNSVDVTATATAGLIALAGIAGPPNGIRPWAVRDRCAPDPPDCTKYEYPAEGELVTLKFGTEDNQAEQYWFTPVALPPVNKGEPVTGAAPYRTNVEYGYDGMVEVGDVLRVEPGNVVGPTQQGVNYLIDQDPGASWDTTTTSNTYNQIIGSAFSEGQSPRIIIVAFYNPNIGVVGSPGEVTVTRLGVFFLEGSTGGGAGSVTGRFMGGVSSGTLGPNSQSKVYGVRLTE